MERHLDHELADLKADLVRMAGGAEAAVSRAVGALLSRDVALADDVVRADAQLDRLEVAIDERCLLLFARYHPEAGDLRLLAMALKLVNDLERIGDQAVNIAERALALFTEPSLDPPRELPAMAELAQRMLRGSVEAFVQQDPQAARDVCLQDDRVDALDDAVSRQLMVLMTQDRHTISRAVQWVLISRHLERVADHATNIAEDVVYLVEGRPFKHRRAAEHAIRSSTGPS
jgi:phosphate transport system protein